MPKPTKKSLRQNAAEADVKGFKDDLGPFVVAAETTRMAMIFADAGAPGYPIIFANDAFLDLTGYAREEVLGQSFNFLMAQGADAEALARIEAEFRGAPEAGTEIRYRRKDGSTFWAALFICPVRDMAGGIVQYFASFVDLTRHKDAETHLKMLIDELNHRVKNTLATVQSIVWQALRTAPGREGLRGVIEPRLFALSRSHDLLTRENWEGAGLRDVLTEALEPFMLAEGPKDRVAVTGENIRLAPKAALALGIAFNELATNAVKYGAFSTAAGRIAVDWTVEPGPEGKRLLLHWRETGGPPVTPPLHKGFGTRVLEQGLAGELDGTVDFDYRPGGLICTMHVNAPEPRHG
ncbi:MAG: HWE histidine kinase domain-containing protein [Parvibaculum sp.]